MRLSYLFWPLLLTAVLAVVAGTVYAAPAVDTFPYSENFDGGLPVDWTVENSNGDAYVWESSSTSRRGVSGLSVWMRWNLSQAMDDWLFTPVLTLDANTAYAVRFFYQTTNGAALESLEVAWGTGAASTDMSGGVIFSDLDFNHTTMRQGTAVFTPTVSGDYHIGFHGMSDANQYYIVLDDVTVYEAPHTWQWEGTADGDWGTAANWEGEIVPGELDDVIIPSGTPNEPTVDAYFSEASYGPVNNLTIQPDARLNLTTNATLSVNGTLTNNGTFAQTRYVTLGGTVSFLTTAGYGGVDIEPTSINMGDVTVAIHGNQSCTDNPADALVHRCFDITPTTPARATIRFHYLEAERNSQAADMMQVWHYDTGGSQWNAAGISYTQSEAGTTCTADPCWVEALDVTDYSPFALGAGSTPTAVSFSTAAADSTGASVMSMWLFGLLLSVTGGAILHGRRATGRSS